MITAKTLQEIIAFAVEKHGGQVRKSDGRPYILHPMSVAMILLKIKKSNNLFYSIGVAFLHDVIEDCNVSIHEIARRFGNQIAGTVQELTTDRRICGAMGKKRYLAKKMIHMSSYALRFKLADRLDNISDLENMTPEFRNNYILETKHILKKLKKHRAHLTFTHKKLINKIKKHLSN